MKKDICLVITSIAGQDNAVLKKCAEACSAKAMPFIVIGDSKSPQNFDLKGCDFYSLEKQKEAEFDLAKIIPTGHYARKNLGYLLAMAKGANVIIETDDDNFPLQNFWGKRESTLTTYTLQDKNWVNVYRYFTDANIWPRGFALEKLQESLPNLNEIKKVLCPIQQGLADENPDVDAIYRLTLPLPITFNKRKAIALGKNTLCPFNSQNTTWFKEAFSLMYLPSYCSFRMTDIWRSFVAQRIAWECNWYILFHNATVYQERNEHNLMKDFADEISGYTHNFAIMEELQKLNLKKGVKYIPENMKVCYQKLVAMGLVAQKEMNLLEAWTKDIKNLL